MAITHFTWDSPERRNPATGLGKLLTRNRNTLTVPGDRPGRCLLAGVVHSLALTGNTIEYKNAL